MLSLYCWLKSRLEAEEGQDLIEYVLIAGLIALVAVVAITAAGNSINVMWNAIAAQLNAVAG
ncbi:MAG: Flp family type IVb pilin [Caldilineaceae bacterium]